MKRRTLPVLLLPLALLLAACGGASSANSGGSTDGKGSLTLNVGDQKGGYEAILRASGELDDLGYRIKW
ncbi:ABC transporter substrate-binding protein, partial [Streptomyces sp. SID7499]|nr:ABC transporter substrate-binding protein [Streptomyces sp. SID7499]